MSKRSEINVFIRKLVENFAIYRLKRARNLVKYIFQFICICFIVLPVIVKFQIVDIYFDKTATMRKRQKHHALDSNINTIYTS